MVKYLNKKNILTNSISLRRLQILKKEYQLITKSTGIENKNLKKYVHMGNNNLLL